MWWLNDRLSSEVSVYVCRPPAAAFIQTEGKLEHWTGTLLGTLEEPSFGELAGLYQIEDERTWIDLRNLPDDPVAWQRENPGLVTIELGEGLELNIGDRGDGRRTVVRRK